MRIIISTYLTLDGVMQSPGAPEEDAENGFTQGGWQHPYTDDGLGERVTAWLDDVDGLLLGRKTYDIFAGYWPTVSGEIADRINALPKYVVSTTLEKSDWPHTTILNSVDAVRDLRARPGGDLLVFGSGDLVGTLLDDGLVDELRVWTYPVVLGDGKRLFEPGRKATALRLVESTASGTGCVLNVYRPEGAPAYGDMAERG